MLANVRFVPLTLLPGFAVLAVNVLTNLNSPETALVVGFIGMCVSIGLAIHDLELRYTTLWSQKASVQDWFVSFLMNRKAGEQLG